MTSITVSKAEKMLGSLIDDVTESHVPIQISGKKNSGVLLSADDWRAIQETLYLNNIPGMRESIVKGLKTPIEKCDKDPGW